jgi:hypothetical protein
MIPFIDIINTGNKMKSKKNTTLSEQLQTRIDTIVEKGKIDTITQIIDDNN